MQSQTGGKAGVGLVEFFIWRRNDFAAALAACDAPVAQKGRFDAIKTDVFAYEARSETSSAASAARARPSASAARWFEERSSLEEKSRGSTSICSGSSASSPFQMPSCFRRRDLATM